jgi:hypothetical protein
MVQKTKALAYVVIERAGGWYWVLARRSVELRVVATGPEALPDPGFHAVNDAAAGSAPGTPPPSPDARNSPAS